MALIKTHPNLGALSAEMGRLIEKQVSLSNPVPVTDDYMDGQNAVCTERQAYANALHKEQKE